MEEQKRGRVAALFWWVLFAIAVATCVFSFLQIRSAKTELSTIDLEMSPPTQDAAGIWQNKRTLSGVSLSYGGEASLSDDVYVTPEGFKIKSYSEKWSGEKLKEIYEEIMRNGHGSEMQYLDTVLIYPDGNERDDFNILGTQSSQEETFELYADFPAFLPVRTRYNIRSSTSELTLYNMDRYDTVELAAHTISHEYGHHFTRFYFFEDESQIMSSDYYKVRGLSAYPKAKEYDDYDLYMANYEWSILEMAAEDYVQILGSPNAKVTEDYKDVKEALAYYVRTGKELKLSQDDYFNAYPQINIFIPLAAQVPGLADYYHSFLNDGIKTKPAADPQIELSFTRSKKHYEVSWNKISGGELYTLVCYEKDGSIYRPIKTVTKDEKQTAVIGTVSQTTSRYIYTYSDGITKDDRLFKLYVMLSDGTIVSSELIEKAF